MTFQLRDYQQEAIEAIEASWDSGINRPACILSTGSGKTVIFSALIARHIKELRKQGKRALVVAHREELLEQAESKIKAMVPDAWVTVVKGSRGQKTHQYADVVVASVQTLARPKRRAAVDRIGMVIVDEAHLYASRTFRDVLAHYGCMDDNGTPTVGFTATMTRMQGGLPDVWQSVAYTKSIAWMVSSGYLVKPVARTVSVPGLSLDDVRVTAGDFNSKDVAAQIEKSGALEAIADRWQADAADRPTIAFLPNVATAQAMTDTFTSRGVAAELVTGETPSTERKAAYGRYSSGVTRILVSVDVLTTGFDQPSTSCIILGRPTLNPGLYSQIIGRGLRLSPGKDDCLVLDVSGASLKHTLACVNDLESDCNASCGCQCLSCGCGDSCKCKIRDCGCECTEAHEAASGGCRCAGTSDCTCLCREDDCVCREVGSEVCACFGEGAPKSGRDAIDKDVLDAMIDIDILGEAVASSGYQWLDTAAGIKFLQVGPSTVLFLLPDPSADGQYFQGRVDGFGPKSPVTRLDEGSLPADEALKALEIHADASGYTYSSKRASWRRTAASEAQAGLLRRLGVGVPEGLRKGEASDLIASAKVSSCLDGRFGKYCQS